jgi:hypothetical protein
MNTVCLNTVLQKTLNIAREKATPIPVSESLGFKFCLGEPLPPLGFSWFSTVSPGKFGDSKLSQIRPRLLHSI